MGRSDQHVGLPQEALDFLTNNEPVCPHCGQNCVSLETIGKYYGMFDNAYPLYRHQLKEGYAVEFVQASPWSGGPLFFLGLLIYGPKGNLLDRITWDETTIEGML